MKHTLTFCAALTGLTILASAEASTGVDWWTADVWQDPDRPFLFYGEDRLPERLPRPPEAKSEPKPETAVEKPEKKKTEPAAADPDDFSRFTTIEALKAEREARLSAAVMSPTPENMRRYQAVNAHMLSLSARFAEAWQLGRFTSPQYDWTATHPSANFVTASLAETRLQKRNDTLAGLGGDLGILFVARPGDPLTPLAAGALRAFAAAHGIEVLAAAAETSFDGIRKGAELEGFEAFGEVRADAGRTKALGITVLPAVVLVPRPEAVAARPDFALMKGTLAGRDGIVVASGAVSGEELARRISLVLEAGLRLSQRPASPAP